MQELLTVYGRPKKTFGLAHQLAGCEISSKIPSITYLRNEAICVVTNSPKIWIHVLSSLRLPVDAA